MIEHCKIAEYARCATTEVFSTMFGMEIAPMPEHLDQTPPMISDGVMALVGFAGTYTGAGVVTCDAKFAIQICNRFLMSEETSVNEDVLDAMGELANMAVGNFKTMIENDLGPIGLSIPTVIYGRNFTSRSVGSNDWVVVPFEYDGDVLEIRICLAPAKNTFAQRAELLNPTASAI
jgi:chemotaxis protein CheX